MKKSYIKIPHELLSTKLRESPTPSPTDFIFPIYNHQAIDLIEFKIYNSLAPKSKKKSPQIVWSIFFENEGAEFINLACILCDPDIVRSILSKSVKTDFIYICDVFQF